MGTTETIQWTGAFENWSRKYVAREGWRVVSVIGGFDDALAECALCFARCLSAYSDKVDNPAWMMSLYKIAVQRRFATLSERDHRFRAEEIAVDNRCELPSAFEVAAFMEARPAVREVLSALAECSAETMRYILKDRGSKRLQRLVKCEHEDIVGAVDLLKGTA